PGGGRGSLPRPLDFSRDLQGGRRGASLSRPWADHCQAVGRRAAPSGPARRAGDHQAHPRPRRAARRGLHVLRRPVRARRAVQGRALPRGRPAPRRPRRAPAAARAARPRAGPGRLMSQHHPDPARALRRRRKHERQAVIFGSLIAFLALAGLGATAVYTGAMEVSFLERDFTTPEPEDTGPAFAPPPCLAEDTLPVDPATTQIRVL